MIPDLDIYRSANLLVKQHGQDAPIEAAMRADAMLEKGDLDGCAVWKRILRAVGQWLAPLYWLILPCAASSRSMAACRSSLVARTNPSSRPRSPSRAAICASSAPP